MSIKYQIVKNDLKTGGETNYISRTILNGTISGEELINALCWGSTLTPADCKAFLTNLERVLEDQLSSGFAVDLGFLRFKPSLKGGFSELSEPFSKSKHSIQVKAKVNQKLINRITAQCSPKKAENRKPFPTILSFYNFSLEQSSTMRVGDLVELKGHRLKFEKENPELGVFLVKADGTRIPVSEYADISSTRLVFKVPSFPNPNEFSHIEVNNLFGKEVRTGSLKRLIIFLE